MRRKDREKDLDFAKKVIEEAQFMTLSAIYKDQPYSIPLSYALIDDEIFIHGAKAGTKAEIFKKEPLVRLVFVSYAKVPHKYSHEDIRNFSKPGKIISKVYTTEYASAIAKARVCEVLDPEEKTKALKAICLKYTPDMMEFFDLAMGVSLDRTGVWKLKPEEITGKAKFL